MSVIYEFVNTINNKVYVGQTKDFKSRIRCHRHNSKSYKKTNPFYNAIRKYGVNEFVVELIEHCELIQADDREIHYIKHFNSLFPNGYNLKNGGNVFTHSEESKRRVSNGVINYFKNKKYERFKNIKRLDEDIEKYIKPLNRNNSQYGWYVYIDKKKADFGGVHISLEESKKNAIEFINNLKNHLAKCLDAGSPLEPMLSNK